MYEVEDYKPEVGSKSVIATFTVFCVKKRIRIRKCKLLKLKSGHQKIVLPSYSDKPFSERSPDDPLVFKDYIEFFPEEKKELEQEVLLIIQSMERDRGDPSSNESLETPF